MLYLGDVMAWLGPQEPPHIWIYPAQVTFPVLCQPGTEQPGKKGPLVAGCPGFTGFALQHIPVLAPGAKIWSRVTPSDEGPRCRPCPKLPRGDAFRQQLGCADPVPTPAGTATWTLSPSHPAGARPPGLGSHCRHDLPPPRSVRLGDVCVHLLLGSNSPPLHNLPPAASSEVLRDPLAPRGM